MSNKWRDLQERIAASLPLSRPPAAEDRKLRSKRFLTTEDTVDMVTRYEAGETTRQVGARYGISKTRVATVLREQGVTIRRQCLATEQVTEAAALYAAGRSLAWIGNRFGVSHTTIAAVLRQHGVQLRSRPGWHFKNRLM